MPEDITPIKSFKIISVKIQLFIHSIILSLNLKNLNLHLQKISMIHFFLGQSDEVFVLQTSKTLSPTDTEKLEWLFGGAKLSAENSLSGFFVGPRAAMITPWSTNAVEITQNMDIQDIIRIEEFKKVETSVILNEISLNNVKSALVIDREQKVQVASMVSGTPNL
mgnify:CR=1 FL=1